MSVERVRNDFKRILSSSGRTALHTSFPDDFEMYMCAFELVNYLGETVEFFTFPVNPSSIQINGRVLTSIQKSAYAVIINNNPSFVPFPIKASGTFGRKFKALVGNRNIDVSGIRLRTGFNNFEEFDVNIKNGYGITKVLEKIFKLSQSVDRSNQPYRLFFYNHTFNHSHMVEVLDYDFNQNDSRSNMMWEYSFVLQAVAPALGLKTEKSNTTSLKKSMGFGALNLALTSTLDNTLGALRNNL